MQFTTPVSCPTDYPPVSHGDKLMLIGSCFTENMGKYLSDAKFCCDINPYGILYNPASICTALNEIIDDKQYGEADLFYHDGRYNSLMHHGDFSESTADKTLEHINLRICQAHEMFPSLNYLMLTFGTAWIFIHRADGHIVGNCHKLPSTLFERRRLSVEEIVDNYTTLLRRLFNVNPTLRILFTVSPIRHLKDGAHGNQLSKATLMLAIARLQERFPSCIYFPAYEIMLDELRDYRFYADDMVHPSTVAVRYLCERFAETFFTAETRTIAEECEKIKRSLEHRPINKDNVEAYNDFLKQILLKIERLTEKYPNLDFQKERNQCHTLLNP
jgi:hypothetical protein